MKVQKKNYPKVSFIIPTLNAAHFLPSCLNAIRTQEYPQDKIEIIVADGGSTDKTISIARAAGAIIISNPDIIQEPGKTRAIEVASGEVLFFTDADNTLAHSQWLNCMLEPYLKEKNVAGLLPQTIPPPDSSSFNRYLGYLFTDPFTWFVYGNGANPVDYVKEYAPFKKTKNYIVYQFNVQNHPLFGLAQGVGTTSSFKKKGIGRNDDILSGIQLIAKGGLVAYIPKAGVYHYHVTGYSQFLQKYRWRIRNNFLQKIKGMGFVTREQYLNTQRRWKKFMFIPYAFTGLFPFIDALRLAIRYKDIVMLWHPLACIGLAFEIVNEGIKYKLGIRSKLASVYGR